MIRKLTALALALFLGVATQAAAAPRVDIYGPGQNILNLGLASPLVGPGAEAKGMGAQLQKLVNDNLSFLPFLRLTDPKTVLGGTVLGGAEPPEADFNGFLLAGADVIVTSIWPGGDGGGSGTVQMRAYETGAGSKLLGKEYPGVTAKNLPEVADRFCADLLEVLTGNGAFFRSTLVFVSGQGKMKSQICLVKPTGRDYRQITSMSGRCMSPQWSPDGRFIVFVNVGESSHALCVWDSRSGKVQRVAFPGDVVVGPAFTPDNKVAVALSNGRTTDIFLLNHVFKKERVLEGDSSINVSPTFDRTGTKMAFTSDRLGGPQIFMKDLSGGGIMRVSQNGNYNTEANLSPDGTLVVYTRLTSYGQRIFVQDLITGAETQVSFGPGSDEQPSFCADSYFIAYSSTRGGDRGIYLTTRHGGDSKRVPVKASASFPRWGMPGGQK